jgi:hypothetical protein
MRMNKLAITLLGGTATALLLACTTTVGPAADAPIAAAAEAETLTRLERACLQDPLNAGAWRALAQALAAAGEFERAAQAVRQAGMLEQHDLRADLALVTARSKDGPVATRLVARADGLLELRREQAQADAGVLLEIRNGNGIRGMARTLALSLDEANLRVVRLSNQPGFAVGATVVEYHGGLEDAARALAQRVGASQILPVGGGLGAANVRVLLGHDQKKKKPPRRAAMEESPARETISAS